MQVVIHVFCQMASSLGSHGGSDVSYLKKNVGCRRGVDSR